MPFRVFRKPDDLSFARLISFLRSFIIYPSIPIIGMCSNCSTWSIISPIWNFEMGNISKRQQFLFYATRTWFFVPPRLPPNFVVSYNLASIRTFTLGGISSPTRGKISISVEGNYVGLSSCSRVEPKKRIIGSSGGGSEEVPRQDGRARRGRIILLAWLLVVHARVRHSSR